MVSTCGWIHSYPHHAGYRYHMNNNNNYNNFYTEGVRYPFGHPLHNHPPGHPWHRPEVPYPNPSTNPFHTTVHFPWKPPVWNPFIPETTTHHPATEISSKDPNIEILEVIIPVIEEALDTKPNEPVGNGEKHDTHVNKPDEVNSVTTGVNSENYGPSEQEGHIESSESDLKPHPVEESNPKPEGNEMMITQGNNFDTNFNPMGNGMMMGPGSNFEPNEMKPVVDTVENSKEIDSTLNIDKEGNHGGSNEGDIENGSNIGNPVQGNIQESQIGSGGMDKLPEIFESGVKEPVVEPEPVPTSPPRFGETFDNNNDNNNNNGGYDGVTEGMTLFTSSYIKDTRPQFPQDSEIPAFTSPPITKKQENLYTNNIPAESPYAPNYSEILNQVLSSDSYGSPVIMVNDDKPVVSQYLNLPNLPPIAVNPPVILINDSDSGVNYNTPSLDFLNSVSQINPSYIYAPNHQGNNNNPVPLTNEDFNKLLTTVNNKDSSSVKDRVPLSQQDTKPISENKDDFSKYLLTGSDGETVQENEATELISKQNTEPTENIDGKENQKNPTNTLDLVHSAEEKDNVSEEHETEEENQMVKDSLAQQINSGAFSPFMGIDITKMEGYNPAEVDKIKNELNENIKQGLVGYFQEQITPDNQIKDVSTK